MKLTKTVRVKNSLGLHARPATCIVKLLQKCKSEVLLTHKKETASARSIMNILMLAAPKNSKVMITVDGDDAQETMNLLVEAFEDRFGENV